MIKTIAFLILLLVFSLLLFRFIKKKNKKQQEDKNIMMINKDGIHFGPAEKLKVLENDSAITIQGNGMHVNGKPIWNINGDFNQVGISSKQANKYMAKFSTNVNKIQIKQKNGEIKKSYEIVNRTKSKRIKRKHLKKIQELEKQIELGE